MESMPSLMRRRVVLMKSVPRNVMDGNVKASQAMKGAPEICWHCVQWQKSRDVGAAVEDQDTAVQAQVPR